jgi:hypothetical protein
MSADRHLIDARARRRRKQAVYRARQRAGIVVLRVPVPSYALVEYLIATDRLTPDRALHRCDVERAAGEVLAEVTARWFREHW